ncbi:MAG TPA: hypothetical protein VGF81_12880 [Solirubrobacteraceae bacterium]
MSRWRKVLAAVGLVVVMACALPSHAFASSTQQTSLLDDDQLIYVPTQHMLQTLTTLHTLGVDTVKVSLVWQLIAPNANSTKRPANFDATNPADYPPGAWSRWDTLVDVAHELGMNVYFLVIGPAPLWAVPAGNRNAGQGPAVGWMPNPRDYQNFVEAAGTRYSGTYDFSAQAPASSSGTSIIPGVTIPGTTATTASSPHTSPPPARVSQWGIWNEPNERSWMNPWYRKGPHHRQILLQPSDYRSLVDAGYNGLSASGHATDTILVGETANRGIMSPVPFMQALYCVRSNDRPLRGKAATAFACPTKGPTSSFVSQHPGLFKTGYAHHPYGFEAAPNRRDPSKGYVTLYNIPAFERTLNRIFSSYGSSRPGGVPLYLTEWGFKTNPPNPFIHTTLAQQAAWVNQGEYMMWRWPYVKAYTQFLLVDSPPKPHTKKGSALYWSTFQTGLEFQNGTAKPSFAAFQVPIWLPTAKHGSNRAVWGQFRPAVHTTTQYGLIDFQRRGSSTWKQLAAVQTDSAEGFVYTHVTIPGRGAVRLDWVSPSGSVSYSRTVPVS